MATALDAGGGHGTAGRAGARRPRAREPRADPRAPGGPRRRARGPARGDREGDGSRAPDRPPQSAAPAREPTRSTRSGRSWRFDSMRRFRPRPAPLAALGFERGPRAFSPHVPLGRVRVPRRDPALADALLAGEGREFGRLSVERVALMRSDLSSRGARYTELAAARLA